MLQNASGTEGLTPPYQFRCFVDPLARCPEWSSPLHQTLNKQCVRRSDVVLFSSLHLLQ